MWCLSDRQIFNKNHTKIIVIKHVQIVKPNSLKDSTHSAISSVLHSWHKIITKFSRKTKRSSPFSKK